jgi:hypothetical protein
MKQTQIEKLTDFKPSVFPEGKFTISPNSDTPVWHSSQEFDELDTKMRTENFNQTKKDRGKQEMDR